MPLIERAARALAKAEHGTDDWNTLTPQDREQLKAVSYTHLTLPTSYSV